MKSRNLGYFGVEGFGFRGLKQYLFFGDKGNGKSMLAAYLAHYLFSSYAYTAKKYPQLPRRVLWSSQKFSEEIEAKHLGVDLEYWSSPKQLYDLRNVDILWDEVGKDIPAGGWTDTPKRLKQVFSHLRKRGNRLFANTQIYNDIDISFRRQVDRTFKVVKFVGSPDISASLPPVKTPWGLIVVYEMSKNDLENESDIEKQKLKHTFSLPRFCLIESELVKFYDTTMEIPPFRPTELEHVEYYCPNPDCKKVHIEHKKY